MNLWPEPRYPQVKAVPPREVNTPPIILAGPCFAEMSILGKVAEEAAKCGATFLRGGVYRAGTYPPADNFGLQMENIQEMRYQANVNGLKTILEVLDIRLIDAMSAYADAFQVGARHMQDYALLRELRNFDGPVSIKRGAGQKMDEFLGAVEYLMGGKCKPFMIERGGSSFLDHCRWELSISIIPAIKRITGLPIIVDASHGTGRRDLVEPMTLAGVAAGADGWLLETHPDPDKSLSDANQAISLKDFARINDNARNLYYMVKGMK